MKRKMLNLVIISGISGSGKSTTIGQFEDMGFFCVDNLPIELIPKFLELCGQRGSEIDKVALVVDIREKRFLKRYREMLEVIRKRNVNFRVLFLEASQEVLIRRFNETRRKHPLAEASVREGLVLEREILADVKESADIVIDPSDYSIHDLRSLLREHFETSPQHDKLSITLVAFGFKYGIAHDADMVLDVRFLPNPYFEDRLRDRTGKDPEVVRYVLERRETREYLQRLFDFIDYLIPQYIREGKAYLTLGIGCTGGRHRSVVITDAVKAHLDGATYRTAVWYRDIEHG